MSEGENVAVEKVIETIITTVPSGIAVALVPMAADVAELEKRVGKICEDLELYTDVLDGRVDELEKTIVGVDHRVREESKSIDELAEVVHPSSSSGHELRTCNALGIPDSLLEPIDMTAIRETDGVIARADVVLKRLAARCLALGERMDGHHRASILQHERIQEERLFVRELEARTTDLEKTERAVGRLNDRLTELETIHPLAPSIVNELREDISELKKWKLTATTLEDPFVLNVGERLKRLEGGLARIDELQIPEGLEGVLERLGKVEDRFERIDERSLETDGIVQLDHEPELGGIQNRLRELENQVTTLGGRVSKSFGTIRKLDAQVAATRERSAEEVELAAGSLGNRISTLAGCFENLSQDLAANGSADDDDRLRFSGQIDELERKLEEIKREVDYLKT